MNEYPAKKPMKVSTRLLIINCIIFILSYAAIVALVNYSMRQQALVEAESKSKIMSEQYFAIHDYFSHKLKPALFKLVEPILSKEYFEPSWMSSTFAVREIHKIITASGGIEYYVKDAAINARSPENEATPFEKEFILALNENPKLKDKKSIEVIDGKSYLVVLRRGEMMEDACLRCHSSPEQAPGDMVRLYGPERSFNRKVGDVVSAISIRVPLSTAYTEANRLSFKLSLAILPFLLMIFGAYTWHVNRLMIRPLSMIHEKALEITGSNERLGEQIPLPSSRELHELTAAFNKMSVSLRDHVDNLDKLVHERTSDIQIINDQLQQDITERKKAEEQIRILAGLVDIAPAAITVHDLDGDFLYANQTTLDLHGYSKEEFLAFNLRDIDVPESAALIEARIKQIMEAGTASFEVSHYRKDHSTFPLHVFVKLTEWGGKKVFFSIASDITERMRAVKMLQESEERFRAIASNTPDHILMQDNELRYSFVVNPQLGLMEQDMIGKTDYDFLSKEEADKLTKVKRQVLETGKPVCFETSLISKEGKSEYFDGTYVPRFETDGQIKGLIGYFRNVTERRQAEDALRNRESFLQRIFDILPVGLWFVDKDGKLLRGNPAGVKIWGAEPKVSPSEYGVFKARRLPSGEEVAPDDWALAHTIRDKVTIVDELLEIDAFDGKKKMILNYTAPVLDAQGDVQGAIVLNQDITERKKAEDAIKSALAEKEVLLEEVHHRVKNNMQIISSLLNLQAQKIQSPDLKMIFEDTRNRIKSMSFIHEMLYSKEDVSRINCSEYINKLVKDLVSAANVKANEIQTTINIDDIMLSVDIAIPLGLITNELVTNALKYAFPHHGGGELSVSLTKTDDIFTLSVKDNGAGLSEGFDYRNVDTLGLQLVSVMVKQIRGTFRISSERGTKAVITFKQ